MAHEVVRIDVPPTPTLAQLAEEVARTRQPRVLRRGEEDLAVLSPTKPKRRLKGKRPSEADIAASLAAVGSWKDIVDGERLKRELDAARSDTSPPVEL
jgi:hypothetical protein